MQRPTNKPKVAIACGGTGGHLFPGIAVAEELMIRGASVTLLVSPKEVDQQAVRGVVGAEVATLPAVGLTSGGKLAFFKGLFGSLTATKKLFRDQRPAAVLAMGGFTSAAPIWVGRRMGARTYLHDSNTIPGRANRWLAHLVDDAFVYFHETSGRLSNSRAHVVGMPVRPQFQPMDAASARMTLGLAANRPTLLVMGGSQGASGINRLMTGALPDFIAAFPDWQFIHLTGASDADGVRAIYTAAQARAVVKPFLSEMEYALGAATLAVSRSGASSLAELAALRVPAVLVPYPVAADDHQRHNARAFVETGAAWSFEQNSGSPETFLRLISRLAGDAASRASVQAALAQWDFPDAARAIAAHIGKAIGLSEPVDQFTDRPRPAGDEFNPRRMRTEEVVLS